jgi:hypothetical protein
MGKTILTIFAGREANIKILKRYLSKALELKILDEIHFWNYTRKDSDDIYMKSISNIRRTSSGVKISNVSRAFLMRYNPAGLKFLEPVPTQYTEIFTNIINNSFNLDVKAPFGVNIKVSNDKISYDINIGGNRNDHSFVNNNEKMIFGTSTPAVLDENNKINFRFEVKNNYLTVYKNNINLFKFKVEDNFNIKRIFIKTDQSSVGDFTYEIVKNKGFYLMDPCQKKPWINYYHHYCNPEYKDDIIIKCDDDIVFMDLTKLQEFINYRKTSDANLLFANTVNNGIASHYLQSKFNLIPKTLMELEYPKDGLEGSLWESGDKATKLHNYFIDNYKSFIDYNYNNELIQVTTRFSINFFAVKGSDWPLMKDCGQDDEHNLTVEYVKEKNFKNEIYCNFIVAHLSFFRQEDTGIDSDKLRVRYTKLADELNV